MFYHVVILGDMGSLFRDVRGGRLDRANHVVCLFRRSTSLSRQSISCA